MFSGVGGSMALFVVLSTPFPDSLTKLLHYTVIQPPPSSPDQQRFLYTPPLCGGKFSTPTFPILLIFTSSTDMELSDEKRSE